MIWLIHTWHDSCKGDIIRYFNVWHLSMLTCDMTPGYVTWLIDMSHDSLIRDVTHWYVTWLVGSWHDLIIPRMEEIGHKKITTAKISYTFSRSPHTFQGSPQNFQRVFTRVNGSPRNLFELTGNPFDLEMQIFDVWSPPWVVWRDVFIRDVTCWYVIWRIHVWRDEIHAWRDFLAC